MILSKGVCDFDSKQPTVVFNHTLSQSRYLYLHLYVDFCDFCCLSRIRKGLLSQRIHREPALFCVVLSCLVLSRLFLSLGQQCGSLVIVRSNVSASCQIKDILAVIPREWMQDMSLFPVFWFLDFLVRLLRFWESVSMYFCTVFDKSK